MTDNDIYHADTKRIGSSGLKLMAKSPAHYYAQYLDPNRVRKPETQALKQGSAIHAAVLEPHEFERIYVTLDDSKIIAEIGGARPTSTNRYKEWLERQMEVINAKKQIIIDVTERETCLRIRDSVWKHPVSQELLSEGDVEQRIDFTEPTTGVLCKIKPDFLSTNTRMVVDLKTTEDASPEAFGRSSFKYLYHLQAAFYMDGADEVGFGTKGFVFIAAEKTPPYAVAMYYVDGKTHQLGQDLYMRLLEQYKECLQSGVWPAYPEEIKPLSLPGWAFRNV
jgi:hypothetical protein